MEVTHDYIGIRPCGCVVAICYDMGDNWTASEVRDMIRDGMKVERVPIAEAVDRFMEKRACPKHNPPRQVTNELLTPEKRQESLFEVTR